MQMSDCTHAFCKKCMRKWIKHQGSLSESGPSCPTCRCPMGEVDQRWVLHYDVLKDIDWPMVENVDFKYSHELFKYVLASLSSTPWCQSRSESALLLNRVLQSNGASVFGIVYIYNALLQLE